MRPLRLRLEGFGAYQEAQEIVFDDVELFAITGPTGAGKSTILDAMTYALYKSTPRIGSTGLKELKHPGAESAKVELTFVVGEQTWRVVRVVGKENQNRLESLQGSDWRTHPASEKVKELDLKLAEILGMDYETFTRAILLPQGQFDLFLRGAPRERRETLIKLYGLESLRAMRDKVAEKLKGLKETASRLQGELDILAEANEEKISLIRGEIESLQKEEARLSRQAEVAERSLRELEKRFERFGELQSLHRREATWKTHVAEVSHIATRLVQAEKAERVWPQLQELENAQQELKTVSSELAQAQVGLQELKANLEVLRQDYDPQALEAAKADLAKLPVLQAQEARLGRYGGSLEQRHAKPLSFDEDRLEALREAERSFDELRKAKDRLVKVQTAHKQAHSELSLVEESLQTLKTEQDRLKAQGQQAKSDLELLEGHLEAERARQGVLAHRHLLKLGEKCPLCEQVIQTLLPEAELGDLGQLQRDTKAAREKLEVLRSDYKVVQERLKSAQESLPKLLKALQDRQGEENETRAEAEHLEQKLAGLNLEQARQERLQRLAGLADEIRRATGGEAVKAYADGLKHKVKALEAKAQQMGQLESQLSQSERQLGGLQEIARERERSKERLEQLVASLLQEANFASLDMIKSARLSPEEARALKKRQQEHEQEGSFVSKQLRVLEAELGNQDPLTEAVVREAKNTLETLRQSIKTAHGKAESRKTEFARLHDQLQRKREAMKQKAELDRQTDIWEQLSTDLKGDRFQDFLLERYQSGLLSRASELIKELSQHRYTLRMDEGEYKVLDRWTEALRPVRTLSGGESFMASLSLALSLSEHLSRGRIGALFLDEGFGTLDAETLEQVASILEALPTQGRLVGIVTHVEALAERLPRLVVEKSPGGSRVSWRD